MISADNDHPGLDVLYYYVTEIAPMACVLFILRKLPPRRTETQKYRPVRTRPLTSPPARASQSEGYTASRADALGAGAGPSQGGGQDRVADLRAPLLIPNRAEEDELGLDVEGDEEDSDAETEASDREGGGLQGAMSMNPAGVLDTPPK